MIRAEIAHGKISIKYMDLFSLEDVKFVKDREKNDGLKNKGKKILSG